MGLDFFRSAIGYVEKYRKPAQKILHTIQTNGTLLDDDWCAFFKQHNFLVGLSVDGPKEMHDAYRVNKGGAGSFDQVMGGWEALSRRGVDVAHPCATIRLRRTPITRSRCTDSFRDQPCELEGDGEVRSPLWSVIY